MQRGPGAREVLIQAGFIFAVNALLPRVGYWLRWPTRLRGGPLLAYVAWNVAWNVAGIFSFRQWGVPFLSDILGQAADDLEAARQELRVELSREPTRDEVGGTDGRQAWLRDLPPDARGPRAPLDRRVAAQAPGSRDHHGEHHRGCGQEQARHERAVVVDRYDRDREVGQ
jgi:hypothetical protein